MTDQPSEKPDQATFLRVEPMTGKPTYIMVPRKLVVTLVIAYVTMFIMTIASIQWSYYIDRQSNQRWCGIVNLFNDTYAETPPPTEVGKKIAAEFLVLQKDFKCK